MARDPLPAYDTYDNADDYFEGKLHTLAWDEATNAQKTTALIEATQRIDRLRFSGFQVDDDQELEFPRYYDLEAGAEGDEEVPDDILIATYEVAYALLDGVDPDLELDNLRVTSNAYGNVKMTTAANDTPEHTAAGIPSVTAWRYLLPYLAPAKTVKLRRV